MPSARLLSTLFTCALALAAPIYAQAPLSIMPLPAHATAGTGSFPISSTLRIAFEGYQEPRLDRARARFFANLTSKTGILFQPASAASAQFVIKTTGPSKPVQQLEEDESYHLDVTPTHVLLTAPNPLGVLHGLETFLQLVAITPQGFTVASVNIDDTPRFPWRGLMLDSGRHFMPLEVVRQTLDGMEAVKLNVFHWHLSEDQGFRIESKLYPLLQEKGSDGNFYTQAEVREILSYARDRGIRVIPEFDMPGHAIAWFVGYPELASGPGPYSIERQWGVFDPAMDPTRESTYTFLDKFLGEMTALFPDAYFHIGGDECNGKEWDRNPRIQQYMRDHHLKDDAALQAYFTGRVQQLVTRHGKITIGWDEVLQPETPKDVVIQSWRGQESLAQAAVRGNRGILSAGYYIDLGQPASEHYVVDPLSDAASKLTPEQQRNILGGEATMWSEFVTPENVASRIWPRTAAIAERLWSPQQVTDVDSMYRRLATVSNDLTATGQPYQSQSDQMLQRMIGDNDATALKVLASVVEPPKGYTRESLATYDSFTPLNHLVDTVPPESDAAHAFHQLAMRIASGKATPEDWRQARKSLTLWRDNDAALQPILPHSNLAAELAPVSHTLTQTATIGLAALDTLASHQPANTETRQQQLAFLKSAKAPQAILLDQIVPSVEILVNVTKP